MLKQITGKIIGIFKNKIFKNKKVKKGFFYLGLIFIVLPPIFLFFWMFITGLKTGSQNIQYPPAFIFKPTLENYRHVFEQNDFFNFLYNSFVVASFATLISLIFGLPAAYSIARFKQGFIGIGILIARMTPFVSYLLPWYIIFRRMHLIDTYLALITTHLIITLPMVVWLMISFFENIPQEMEEQAMIDGCSRIGAFMKIVIPLVRNGIATSAIIAFIFSWNQFLFSLVLSGNKTKTVPVAVYNFMSYGKIDWGGIGAAATIIVLPVTIFAFFVRRSIVKGLTAGAIKG